MKRWHVPHSPWTGNGELMAWLGSAWPVFGVACFGVARLGVVWCGLAWLGSARLDSAWRGSDRFGPV